MHDESAREGEPRPGRATSRWRALVPAAVVALEVCAGGCALPTHTAVPEPRALGAPSASVLAANLVVVPEPGSDPGRLETAAFEGLGDAQQEVVARRSVDAVIEGLSASGLFSGGVLRSGGLTARSSRPDESVLRAALVDVARRERADYSALLEIRYGPVRARRNWLLPLAWVPGVVIGAQEWAPIHTVRSELTLALRFYSRLEARQTHFVTCTDQVDTLAHDPVEALDRIGERAVRHAVPRLLAQVLERPDLFASHRDRTRPVDVSARVCLGSFALATPGGAGAASSRLEAVCGAIPALLGGSLVQRGFTLAARRDLDEVLAELRIQRTEMFDRERLTEIGRLAGAELVITGTAVELDDAVLLEVVGYDIRTGLSVIAASARIEPTDDLKMVADDLAARVVAAGPGASRGARVSGGLASHGLSGREEHAD